MGMTINSATCLLDLKAVIIDRPFIRPLLESLSACVQNATTEYNWEGVTPPAVLGGTIDSDARA
jgi:hypothetical protein